MLGRQMVKDFGNTGGELLTNGIGNMFGFALNGISK